MDGFATSPALFVIIFGINLADNAAHGRAADAGSGFAIADYSESIPAEIPILDEFHPAKDEPKVVAGCCEESDVKARWLNAAITKESPNDPESVIDFLGKCSRAERRKIIDEYSRTYEKNLVDEITRVFSPSPNSSFPTIVSALVDDLPNYLANRLHTAVSSTATIDYELLRLILTPPHDQAEIDAITRSYRKAYKSDLKERLRNGTTDETLRSILDSQLQARESEETPVDNGMANDDAIKILRAIESGKWQGDCHNDFHDILLASSYPHLRKVIDYYDEISSEDLFLEIAETFSTNAASAYSDILAFAEDKNEWFATILSLAMLAKGPKVDAIILIVTWRAEIDLGNIKTFYDQGNDETLYDDVEAAVQEDLVKKVLLAIIGK